jgi:hypothetical protein
LNCFEGGGNPAEVGHWLTSFEMKLRFMLFLASVPFAKDADNPPAPLSTALNGSLGYLEHISESSWKVRTSRCFEALIIFFFGIFAY